MKLTISGIIVLVLLALFSVGSIYIISVRNDFVRIENQLSAIVEDSRNVHSSFTLGLKTQGLAVEKYGEMVVRACEATYGQGGARAAVLLLQKQNPEIEASVVARLQVAIEAGYARFEQVQRSRIDVVRVYRNKLQEFPTGVVAGFLGFPRVDLKKLGEVVTSTETKKTFDSGVMDPVDPFAK